MLDEEMPGWKTLAMSQANAHEGWVQNWRRIDIRENLEHMGEFVKPEDSILDIGCYAGYFMDFFRRENYMGIDIFPEHVKLARDFHPDLRHKFKAGDLFDTRDRADVVICSRVLTHLPRFNEAVSKLISAANRLVIAVLKIEPVAKCEQFTTDRGTFWQRSFTEEMVSEAFGECRIFNFWKYSNVYKFIN